MVSETVAQFDVHEARVHLSCIIDRVERGEEIIITRKGAPAVKVVPMPHTAPRVDCGSLPGRLAPAERRDSPETDQVVVRDVGIAP